MILHLSTWKEVEDYLARSKGVIIPIGSTEQHGPNGIMGTDSICAEVIAQGVGQSIDALITPTIYCGVAQFNLDFAGTLTVRPTTLIALIKDTIFSLAHHGFERFYFLNGHGGNVAPARSAFQEIYHEKSLAPSNRPKIRCRLRSWWEHPNTDKMRHEQYGEWEGFHCTPSEVAMTQFAYPDSIKSVETGDPTKVSMAYIRDHPSDDHYEAEHHRRIFPTAGSARIHRSPRQSLAKSWSKSPLRMSARTISASSTKTTRAVVRPASNIVAGVSRHGHCSQRLGCPHFFTKRIIIRTDVYDRY